MNSRASDVSEQLLALSGGPFTAVLDCVSTTDTAKLGFTVLAKGGKMVLVGLMGGELNLSVVAFIGRAATIMGNTTGHIQHLQEVTELAKARLLNPIPGTCISRNEAPEALELLRKGQVAGRIVLI